MERRNMDAEWIELGNAMAQLRECAGLSQEEFAEEMEVSRQTVSKWELGLAYPSAANLKRIGDYFDVPVEQLRQLLPERRSKQPAPEPPTPEPPAPEKRRLTKLEKALIGAVAALLVVVVVLSVGMVKQKNKISALAVAPTKEPIPLDSIPAIDISGIPVITFEFEEGW